MVRAGAALAAECAYARCGESWRTDEEDVFIGEQGMNCHESGSLRIVEGVEGQTRVGAVLGRGQSPTRSLGQDVLTRVNTVVYNLYERVVRVI